MWPFTPKPKTSLRSTIDGATVKALLDAALSTRRRSDYRHFATKETTSVVTRADVETASRKAFKPWKEGVWECEDQARALVHEAQKAAANEGRSWAVGTLRARAPYGLDGLHVYAWAVVQTEGRFAGREICVYDSTARRWVDVADLNDVDYTMT